MDKIKVAIVGCGGIHKRHSAAIREIEGTQLIVVCDTDEERAKASAQENNCAWTTDYKEVLANKEVQVVHLCLPHYLHASMSIEAMEAGKAVLLEKPLGMTSEEGRSVIEAQKKTGAFFGVCFQNRYRPVINKLKDIMNSDEAGEILCGRAIVTWARTDAYYKSASWRGTWAQEGGGVLINQTIHTLDLLQWVFGGIDAEKVKGSISNNSLGGVIEVEDTAEIRMVTNDGKVVLFYGTNAYTENSQVLIDITCENVSLRAEEELTVRWNDGRVETFTEEQATGAHAYWGLDHETLIKDFYAKYASGEKFEIDAEEAIKSLDIIDRVYKNSPLRKA
jgi:UDP-N-acetyl-2-amino-2-deoxyglucuronate dehydrogenase